MAELRRRLISKLEGIPGIEVRRWKPDADFTVIEYHGKEVAHFHGNNELDVRLSKEIVKRDGLTHATNRIGHPDRKNGGRWLITRFTRDRHLDEMVRLVKLAIELR
ncbi:MAG: luciferase family protein [Burkholderiaceae bacterium]